MSVKKERVDVLLVERGLIETREKAKRAVMAGLRTPSNKDAAGVFRAARHRPATR